MDNRLRSKNQESTRTAKQNVPDRSEQGNPQTETDHLYQMLKPLHNLPRGKNTWNPQFIKIWWFWPACVAAMLALYYLYPMLWNLLFTR